MKKIILIVLTAFQISCGPAKTVPEIVDRPIEFNQQRLELTREYLKERYGLKAEDATINPKMIVVHWTAIPTLEASFKAFDPVKLPGARGDIKSAGDLNVSAHFLIDRDGTIYRLMPENIMARHVIGLNHVALGIENVGGTPETPLTRAQLKANIKLVKYLSKQYEIDYLIGHFEYTLFEGHALWLERDADYRTTKTDPGENFMQELRNATKSFNFKPVPTK
ncbi:peptidoglycan recognition protein family protein [Salegentibacter sp. HM20]